METNNITMMLEDIKSAWDVDHPQSAITKFNEAYGRFFKEKDYKGVLIFFKQCLPMSDMLAEEMASVIDRIEVRIIESENEPVRALFLLVKGLAIKQKSYRDERVKAVFEQALAHPDKLDVPLADYEWFLGSDMCRIAYGKDNHPIFGHNLLSYIVQETSLYGLLAKYYEQINNHDAACYARYLDFKQYFIKESLWELVENNKETPVSLYALETIMKNSLIGLNCYKPIEERNSLVSKVVNLLQSYMEQFPNWPDIGMATKLLEKFAEPEAKIHMEKTIMLPNKTYSVCLERKNIEHMTISIYRTCIENRKGHHEIHSKIVEKSFDNTPVFQKDYDFELYDKHHWQSSCIDIGPLTPGLYKMVVIADGKICFVELLQVSQLCLLVELLPKNRKRIAVLDASKGLPVPFAGVHLKIEERVAKYKVLKCDEKGETIWDSSNTDASLYPFLQDDQWGEAVSIYDYDSYEYDKMTPRNTGEVLTDRSIYRPGQTVHITVVHYCVNESNKVKTIQQESLEVTLTKGYKRDVVWKKVIKSDDYGIAQTDFHIPENLEPGDYSLRVGDGLYTGIKIEEYKRPTYKVKLEPYTQPYKMGDTLIIRGKATSFAGVPVANAKVNYETFAEMSMWFYQLSFYWGMGRYTYRSLEECVSKGETNTDQEGNFKIKVPLQVDESGKRKLKDRPLFLDVTANVDVVDITGETQSDTITLPLSNRDWMLFADLDYRIEQSSGFAFIPTVRNSVGNIHDCKINYRIDDGEWSSATSGEKVLRRDIPIGKHVLQLEYLGEKYEREFILFDSNSCKAPCETDCWEYLSSDEFPEDGSPVVIQVGNSHPNTYILYDVFSGNHLVESGAFKTESGMIRRELPYEEKYGNGILVNFAWVRNQEVQHCSMTVKKPIPQMELNHQWILWQNEYTPGGHVKWVAKINDFEGLHTPTNTIAVVYDKALDQLQPHSWNKFGPKLDWNTPETEWKYYELDSLERRWRASASPYNDVIYECGNIACCPSPSSHKYGHYNRMDSGGCCGVLSEEKSIRNTFVETAYYASNIRTNDNGELEIEFDLPDTLTTWKLMVVSFTQDMHWCYVEEEFISKKNLMLTANIPRFARVGDKTVISAKVTNLTGQEMKVMARMELQDAKSRENLFSDSKPIEVGAGSTMAVSFKFVPDEEIDQYVCRVLAQSNMCSDGEEKMIPVIPDKTMVTATHVFDQDGPGLYQVHPNSLFPVCTTHHQLQLDYTNNALWLAVKAMKGLVKYDKDNAISLMVALYSALLTKYLNEQVIGKAKESKTDKEIDTLMELLKKLQHFNGGFSWYKGMPSSEYITTEVLMHLSRLSAIIDLPEKVRTMMEDGFCFVDKEMHRIVRDLRLKERKGIEVTMPSFMMLQHLYNNAMSGRIITRANQDDYDYLVNLMHRDIHRQTIYEKAMSALILQHAGKMEQAKDYVESLCQYTEVYENRGRSFKTSRASYSWYSYKIPTHVAAMEAIHRICPDRRQIIVEMQKWLLNEKRTQTWETPVDSVNAMHALLLGNVDILHEEMMTNIIVDDERLDCKAIGEEGHIQAELDSKAQLVTFKKETKGLAWGAVYANFLQPLSDVSVNGSGMTIKREIITPKKELHVGDRITVRLTYTCDRNYDMVEIVDSKAACMEPVNQLSWYDSYKNVAPYDTKIVYSYYGLAEGSYSMETEFWLDRPGTYEIGLATIQCAYAREFRATCPSQKLVVLP